MTLEEMKVIIRAETEPFRKEIAKMRSEMGTATAGIEQQTSRIRNSFSKIGKVVSGLGIGYALFRLGKQAIGFASDLQEVQNVVDTAFGDMAYKCEAFSKNAIKQFGMSELSAKKTASTFMAMGKGIGLASDQASDMAIQLAARSGDVASFFNISQEEAATKLKSVFTGETETLKDLGVVMTQTNLKQYALSHGMSGNIEQMDQASLTTLRYKFVMDQLSLSQGDFAKTSGTWANQVRILQEQWKQLMGIIGNGLIAVFTPVIHVINVIIGKIIQFAQVVQAVFSSLFGKKGKGAGDNTKKISSSMGAAADNAGALNNNLDKTTGKANKAAKAMGQLASIDEINNLSSSQSQDTGGSGTAGGGVSGIGGIDGFDLGFGEEADTSGIDKTVAKVKKKINDLKSFLSKNKAVIIALTAGIIAGVGTFAVLKNIGAIQAAIATVMVPIKTLATSFQVLFMGISEGSGVFTTLSAIFGTSLAPILAISIAVAAVTAALVYLYQTSDSFRELVNETISNFLSILQNLYNSVLVPLFTLLMDMFNTVIVPLATFIATVFVKAVEAVYTVSLTLWNSILIPIANFLVDILGIALQGVIDIWNGWKPVIEDIFAALQWLWDEILSPIVDWIKDSFIKTFEDWGDVIKELIPSVKKIFQGFVDFLVGVFTLDMDKCWQGITKIFQGFDDFLTKIFAIDWSKSFGSFGDILNAFMKTASDIWESIKKVFNGVITFINGIFYGNWSAAWQGICDIFGGIFGGMAAIAKAPINAVIGLINSAISSINKISADIPDWVPGFGGKHLGFALKKIPYLARGAVVSAPTPAIFGENGAEAVIPLENNTGWMAKIAAGISQYIGFGGFGEDINDMIILMQELIDIVREKDLTAIVRLDEREINKTNNKEELLNVLRTG